MVITNPAEQLRGLPGPTEPSYQNKPAATTCREEGGGEAGKRRWEGEEGDDIGGERFT